MPFIRYTLFLLFISPGLTAQKPLLDNPAVLEDARECLADIYNFDFPSARYHLQKVKQYSPQHPAVPFLKALVVYWENFPITPGHEKEELFLKTMEQSIKSSELWADYDEDELEAIFFDMISRAFFVMYWADNGKPGKVFPHLNRMYRHVMEGFELKDIFNEFYFTTGLYNYYVIAYPEKHPAYAPVVALFKNGNKKEGLTQLEYCAENSVFLRVEARFFLSLLYMNYELNYHQATRHAAELYREFPSNSYYLGKYLEFLLYDKKYFLAPVLISKLKDRESSFDQMQYHLYSAFYLEKVKKSYIQAKRSYATALNLAAEYGDFAGTYEAIALMGLGRMEASWGNHKEAGRYFRKAKNKTSYRYILDDI